MYNSSHLSRLLAEERQREFLAVAERERAARAVPQESERPAPRARRLVVFRALRAR